MRSTTRTLQKCAVITVDNYINREVLRELRENKENGEVRILFMI